MRATFHAKYILQRFFFRDEIHSLSVKISERKTSYWSHYKSLVSYINEVQVKSAKGFKSLKPEKDGKHPFYVDDSLGFGRDHAVNKCEFGKKNGFKILDIRMCYE